MIYKDCKYKKNEMGTKVCQIQTEIDGVVWVVPLEPDNTDYAEIMRQVDAGELTIEPADE